MKRYPQEKSLFGELVKCFQLLKTEDRKRIVLVTLIQIIFGLLDLLGVAVIGIVSALIVRGLNAQGPGDRVGKILEMTGLDQFSSHQQVVILGISAVLILSSKTIFSVVLLRKTLYYLSRRGSQITTELFAKLLNKPLIFINSEPLQKRLFSITTGVSNLTVGVLTNTVLIISDLALLIMLSIGLFLIDPVTSVATFLIFGAIGLILYFLLHTRAANIGLESAKLIIRSNELITEGIVAFRELTVRGTKQYFLDQFRIKRASLAEYDAEIKFLPNISKYVTELTVVIGITVISVVQLRGVDPNRGIAVLTVFLAASTRIAPAVMRLQQSAISVKSYIASAGPTLDLAMHLKDSKPFSSSISRFKTSHPGFDATIDIENVSFSYENPLTPEVNQVSLRLPGGSVTALVGPSGGGKSTLVDLILGILEPSVGSVKISGLPILEALEKWPGAIGYVPQDIFIVSGTIKENVSLGYLDSEVPDSAIWEALDSAELGDFVRSCEGGLNYLVGDSGNNLSGGQRQRLGIARALLTKPKLVVMDEATSALDADTENRISESLLKLKGESTLLIVAHRLSTIRFADQVGYIQDGSLIAKGTFESIKNLIPDFQRQANFMGL